MIVSGAEPVEATTAAEEAGVASTAGVAAGLAELDAGSGVEDD